MMLPSAAAWQVDALSGQVFQDQLLAVSKAVHDLVTTKAPSSSGRLGSDTRIGDSGTAAVRFNDVNSV
ncbi:MAG: hypothetical protein FJX25_18545 [Alphaproteobacteria bacterium]|nr:hypothetical protein [Alphaproteobacteria bacterium]